MAYVVIAMADAAFAVLLFLMFRALSGVLAMTAVIVLRLGLRLIATGLLNLQATLLLEALARSNDQQLAGAIIFLLTATIVGLNFITDVALAALDPRMRSSVLGGRA